MLKKLFLLLIYYF